MKNYRTDSSLFYPDFNANRNIFCHPLDVYYEPFKNAAIEIDTEPIPSETGNSFYITHAVGYVHAGTIAISKF